MSDIAKNIFNTTDKLNLLSNTNNITNLVSKFENFTNTNESEEKKRQRLCRMVVIIRVLYVLTIFLTLYYANNSGVISNELFMGLALLSLAMPDIVLVVMIIMFVVNNRKMNRSAPPEYSATSSEGMDQIKYALTSTPDVFN